MLLDKITDILVCKIFGRLYMLGAVTPFLAGCSKNLRHQSKAILDIFLLVSWHFFYLFPFITVSWYFSFSRHFATMLWATDACKIDFGFVPKLRIYDNFQGQLSGVCLGDNLLANLGVCCHFLVFSSYKLHIHAKVDRMLYWYLRLEIVLHYHCPLLTKFDGTVLTVVWLWMN